MKVKKAIVVNVSFDGCLLVWPELAEELEINHNEEKRESIVIKKKKIE